MKKIIILVILLCLVSVAYATTISYNVNDGTWTEIDADALITKTSNEIVTFTNKSRVNHHNIYKDFGVNYWSGNFEFWGIVNITSADVASAAFLTTVKNSTNDLKIITDASGEYLTVQAARTGGGVYNIYVQERHNGSGYSDNYTYTLNTKYYYEFERDESVGTYGSIILRIYSDASHTTLLDTLTVALHEKTDYRYLSWIDEYKDGVGAKISGTITNLKYVYTPASTKIDGGVGIGVGVDRMGF